MQDAIMGAAQEIFAAITSIVTGFVIWFINIKIAQAKETLKSTKTARYLDEVEDAVSTAVKFVSQTYVDELKRSNMFSANSQREALNRAVTRAGYLLTREARKYLTKSYSDIKEYLTMQIEAEIKESAE